MTDFVKNLIHNDWVYLFWLFEDEILGAVHIIH